VNATHDPALKSWVASANEPASDFPIQNLPFGVFHDGGDRARAGVAIGDAILDVARCLDEGVFTAEAAEAAASCRSESLNALMAMGPPYWSALRAAIGRLLRDDYTGPRRERWLIPAARCTMLLPAAIGDYTDFYASIHHATNVGRMFRPDNPLLPNYKYVPVGYHGRASSVVASGATIRRPHGQTRSDPAAPPTFGPCRMLDYECEVGFFIGPGNALGDPVPIETAGERLFGACIVNDWSARDIQSWEYQPLGPFLAKSFATTISPWIVTMEALEPFLVPPEPRHEGDPAPLPYLARPDDRAIDLTLEVWLTTQKMRAEGVPPHRLSRCSARDLYWTPAQMVAHHASNGCNLRPGDLLASGTVSGASKDALGCLLEITARGAEPITLPTGETRRFLEEGDEVCIKGWCERAGLRRIGLGECRGVVTD
jgi:fumarylacetoacetase